MTDSGYNNDSLLQDINNAQQNQNPIKAVKQQLHIDPSTPVWEQLPGIKQLLQALAKKPAANDNSTPDVMQALEQNKKFIDNAGVSKPQPSIIGGIQAFVKQLLNNRYKQNGL